MATIGTFTAQGDGYTGSIKTLTLNVKAAVLRPNEKSNDKPISQKHLFRSKPPRKLYQEAFCF